MDKESTPENRAELTLTKRQVAVVLLVFIVSLVSVGLLAGLVRPARTSLAVRQPGTPRASSASDAEPWLNGRLPRHVLPVHYDLDLFPDFYEPDQHDGKFYGNVSILINVTSRPTRHLLVHARQLTIHRTSVRLHQPSPGTSTPVHVQRAFEFARNQYLVVELDADLQPGSAVWLDMRFEGSMAGRLSGLYRTNYVDPRTRQTRSTCQHHHRHHVGLGSLVAKALDLQLAGCQFNSRPRRCRVTTLGKLFTPTCLSRSQWFSDDMIECGVTGRGQLCLSRQPLRCTVLGTG